MVINSIKDHVLEWYFSHFIFSKSQIIDQPGFIIFNISGKSPVFIRQVLVPERFFTTLETRLVKDFGDKGKQLLYSAGKKFGYRLSAVGRFPKRGEISDGKLKDYFVIVDKFIEGMYASLFNHTLDLTIPFVSVRLNKFVVINELGYGYFIPLGGGAGIISWLLNDINIEGVQVEKQGDNFILYYAPRDFLKKNFKDVYTETNLSNFSLENYYSEFNRVTEVKHQLSLKNLIESNFFDYSHGILSHSGERFFIIESSALYILEKELMQESWSAEVLKESALEGGKVYAFQDVNYSKTDLERFLTAFGFGDPFITIANGKVNVTLSRFPWTKFSHDIKFNLIKWFLEGFFSKALNKKIEFLTVSKDERYGYLSLTFS